MTTPQRSATGKCAPPNPPSAIHPQDDNFPAYGFLHKGYWRDLGSQEDYLQAHVDVLNNKITLSGQGTINPEGTHFLPPVFIGNNCKLSPYSQIGPYAVLGDNCKVHEGALVENSVCWNNVVIGTGSVVRNSILGTNTLIGIKQKVEGRLGIVVGTQIHLSPPQPISIIP